MPIYSANPRHCPGSRNTRSGCSCPGQNAASDGSGNPFCTSGALEANAMTPPVTPYCPQQETQMRSSDQSAQSGCTEEQESSSSSRRTRMGLSAFATGYAAGSLSFSEDRPAVFTAFSSQKARSVLQHDGTFTLAKPGTYQITALVNIPAGDNADAVLHLTANGEIIPGSVTRISSASHTGTYVMTAIVISDGSATVALTASQELNLTGAGSADVLAAITFLRLA